jgi:hypothetical protein
VFISALEVRSLVVTIAFFLREPRETSPNGAIGRYQVGHRDVNRHVPTIALAALMAIKSKD